jgi:hypothetical protein
MSETADLWDRNGSCDASCTPADNLRTRQAVNADGDAALDVAQAERLGREQRQRVLEAHGRDSSQLSVPSNQCAICLGQMTQTTKTVIEECFHTFCRECIATWCDKQAAKVIQGDQAANGREPVASCPLCREPIVALLHDIRSDAEFLRSEPKDVRVAAERAAAARRRRVSTETQRALDNERNDPFGPRALARRRAVYSTQQYSHRPYQRAGLTLPAAASPSLRLPSGSGAPDLLSWLRRELTALLGVTDVETIVHYVVGLCEGSGIPAPTNEAPQAGQPLSATRSLAWLGPSPCEAALTQFLGDRTLHFLHELYAFALSPLPLEIYDRIRCYPDQHSSPEPVARESACGAASSTAVLAVASVGQRDEEPRQDNKDEDAVAAADRRRMRRMRKDQRRREREIRRHDKQERRERKRARRRERRHRAAAATSFSDEHATCSCDEDAFTMAGATSERSLASAHAAVLKPSTTRVVDVEELRWRRLMHLGLVAQTGSHNDRGNAEVTEGNAGPGDQEQSSRSGGGAAVGATVDRSSTGCSRYSNEDRHVDNHMPDTAAVRFHDVSSAFEPLSRPLGAWSTTTTRAQALEQEAELRAACIRSMWQRATTSSECRPIHGFQH